MLERNLSGHIKTSQSEFSLLNKNCSNCLQGTEFVPLSEEEVNRRKQEADEKNRAKLEKLNTKREKKQKQAGTKILP